MPVHVSRYALATPMIEDGIEHETVDTSVVTSSKPSESRSPRADYQIHTFFLYEKKRPVHLLN